MQTIGSCNSWARSPTAWKCVWSRSQGFIWTTRRPPLPNIAYGRAFQGLLAALCLSCAIRYCAFDIEVIPGDEETPGYSAYGIIFSIMFTVVVYYGDDQFCDTTNCSLRTPASFDGLLNAREHCLCYLHSVVQLSKAQQCALPSFLTMGLRSATKENCGYPTEFPGAIWWTVQYTDKKRKSDSFWEICAHVRASWKMVMISEKKLRET